MAKKLKPGRELERLVAAIESCLVDDQNATVESPAYLRDKLSGGQREFDVLISYKGPMREITMAIECRDYRRAVDVSKIEAFRSKCIDCGVDKGVMVAARFGFTKQAKQKAQHYGIDCLTVNEAIDENWRYRYSVTSLNRQVVERSMSVEFEGSFQEPISIWEELPTGQRTEISKRDSRWSLERFGEIHQSGELRSQDADGVTTYELHARMTPIEHIKIIDASGTSFTPTSVVLHFVYNETITELPSVVQTYVDTASSQSVLATVATHKSEVSGLVKQIVLVENQDGTVKTKVRTLED